MKNENQIALNQKTKRLHLLQRIQIGFFNVLKKPWKTLALLIGYGLVFLVYLNGKDSFAFADGLFIAIEIFFSIVWTIVFFVITGTPLRAFRVSDDLRRIGLVNEAEEPPFLMSIQKDAKNKKIREYVFDGGGVPLCAFEEAQEKIEAALNISIIEFRWVDGKRKIMIRAVPARGDLPMRIDWDDIMMSTTSFELMLGEGYAEPATINLCNAPHVLIGGSSGSGKTVLLQLILYQCLMKGAEIYIADFKGMDFVGILENRCHMCYDWQETKAALEILMAEKDRRLKMFRSVGAVNIDEYNSRTGEHLPRMIFACDEYAQMMIHSARNKEEKELHQSIEYLTASVARLGRAFGIHLILATQRPDTDVLEGQIKANIDYRICGQADATLSTIVLGDGSADTMIPKYIRGRFLMNDGTLFQAYYFDEKKVKEE